MSGGYTLWISMFRINAPRQTRYCKQRCRFNDVASPNTVPLLIYTMFLDVYWRHSESHCLLNRISSSEWRHCTELDAVQDRRLLKTHRAKMDFMLDVTPVWKRKHVQYILEWQECQKLLTAPVLVLSMLQSGMILDSVTIQLLILSLLRRSTA